MAKKNIENKNRVRKLAANGMESEEIARITGLSVRTVYNYRAGANQIELGDKNMKAKMSLKDQIEWTEAVNRIRRYCGKRPLPMPEVYL